MNLAILRQFSSRLGWTALAVAFLADSPAGAQIIQPTNRVDWAAVAGVEGGIPARAVFQTMTGIDNTGATSVLGPLQSAINSCPANQTVLLPPGTFRIDGSLQMKSRVTLRGSGPNTILKTSGQILFSGGGGRITVNAVSGYNRGSTSITLAAAPADLTVGSTILVSELNNPTFVTPYGFELSGSPSFAPYLDEPDGGTRIRGQMVRVTSIAGAVVGFTPALYSDFGASRAPRVEYRAALTSGPNLLVYSGVQDLTIDNSSSTMVKFEFSQNCWVSNVVFNIRTRDIPSVQGIGTHRINVQHCTFTGFTPSASAVVPYVKNEGWLVENNIFNAVNQSFVVVGFGGGHVFAYNYTHSITNSTSAMISEVVGHGGHPQFLLFEGNVMWKFHADSIHGSASHWTLFRNQIKGRKPGSTFGHGMIWIDHTNYFMQTVGNVLGYSNMITSDTGWTYDYESNPGGGNAPSGVILYRYGLSGYNQHTSDPKAKSTTLRHGNYDYLRNTVEWDPGIADQNIPTSLYLTQRPGWYGNLSWPPFGPDVPGYARMIPAEYRFLNGGAEPPADGADTTPPSTPNGLGATAAGTSQINLSWAASTDNVGVTGYRLERSQGTGSTSFAQVATPAGTSFADTGLTAGTVYNYRVRAADAAGNLSAYSSTATATTSLPAVNQPPTVSLTAPTAGGSTFAPATVALAANATDSDGTITKVEFYEGLNKISEDTSAPYQAAWSGDAPGSYLFSAVAYDNSGAVTLSASVQFAVVRPGISSSQLLPNGSFSLAAPGSVGRTNTVHVSSDLVTWTFLTNLVNTSGTVTLVDPEAAIVGRRFYRVWAQSLFLSNVVGFAKVSVPSGYSILANQFVPATNKVSAVLAGVPGGTSLSKFRPVTGDFSINNYDPIFQEWLDPNQTFGNGDAGFILNPTTNAFTVTFHGQVPQGLLTLGMPAGYSMLASLLPQGGLIQSQLGFPGASGDTVFLYRNGRYRTSQYDPLLGGWDFEPNVNVGEGFFLFKTGATNWTRSFSAFN
jgi:chitodextrinase